MKHLFTILAILTALAAGADETILARHDFSKKLHGWNTPNYWAGSTALVEDGQGKCLELRSGERGGKTFGRSLGYCKTIPFYQESELVLEVRVKGEGKFIPGLLLYPYGNNANPTYMRGEASILADEAQVVTRKFTLPSRLRQVLPFMEVEGAGRALVSSLELRTFTESGVSIQALTGMQVIGESAQAQPVHFQAVAKGREVILAQADGLSVRSRAVRPDANGNIEFTPEALSPGINEVSASCGGAHASAFIDLNAEYAEDDALARRIALDKPISCLFIGGSHCEFFPGQNFIARLQFWLDKYNPGKASIHNAGVAGDFILRVEQRLKCLETGKNPAHRQERYQDIFARQYDLAFLFLGQNDTVTSRLGKHGKFARPQVVPEEQERAYRWVIGRLRQHSPQVRVVIISPSPSNVRQFEEYDRRFAPDQQIHMFGKPEFLDAFDAVNRKLVGELGLGYIDVLGKMRSDPDLPSLYVKDGVHLTPRGGMVVAREVLKWFANEFSEKQP